jgi:hypothetical protein
MVPYIQVVKFFCCLLLKSSLLLLLLLLPTELLFALLQIA